MVQRYRVLFLASSHFWQIVLVFTSGVGMLRFAANLRSLRVLSTLNSASLTSRPLTGVMASSTETSNGQPTVGIIVIGDEILKGQTQDTNSHFLVRRLFTLGARVRRISVIPDDLDVISKEVCRSNRIKAYLFHKLCAICLLMTRKLRLKFHL